MIGYQLVRTRLTVASLVPAHSAKSSIDAYASLADTVRLLLIALSVMLMLAVFAAGARINANVEVLGDAYGALDGTPALLGGLFTVAISILYLPTARMLLNLRADILDAFAGTGVEGVRSLGDGAPLSKESLELRQAFARRLDEAQSPSAITDSFLVAGPLLSSLVPVLVS